MRLALTAPRLAAAALVLTVAGAAAAQATTGSTAPRAADGTATSAITLVDLSVGGHAVSLGKLSLTSGVSAATAAVTALTADGKGYGEHSVTLGTASSPSFDGATALPGPVGNLVTVTAPAASLSAGSGYAKAGTTSLGSVRLLGLPVALDGSATASAAVEGAQAGAEKTLVLRNLSLPGITGLLGALGLDLTKLSPDTLLTLVQKLGLTTSTITDAKAALDAPLAPLQTKITAAQQHVADAQATVASANTTLTSATASLTSATGALDSATQQLQAALGTLPHLTRAQALVDPATLPTTVPTVPTTVPTVPTTVPTVPTTTVPTTTIPTVPTTTPTVPTTTPALPSTSLPTGTPTVLPTALPTLLPSALPAPSLPSVIPVSTQPLVDAYNAAKAAYDAALAKVNDATGALNLANGLLNTANGALTSLLSLVAAPTSTLVHAITDVLGQTPLVSVDSFTIRTEATVSSAAKGGQAARVVGGELQGVHVLGTDVLQAALNSDRTDLGTLTSGAMTQVNAALATVAGTLSGVLSSVPGLPTLQVPAPHVDLLTSTTSTGVDGDFGTARNTVQALRLTLPALTVPAAVQSAPLPGVLSVQALGDLVSQPLSIGIGTMSDAARFRPAANTGIVPPGSSTGTLTAPRGTTPNGSTPTGSTPTGTTPMGSTPAGSNPQAAPPGTAGSPQLPRTGLPIGATLLASVCCAAGLLLRRTARV